MSRLHANKKERGSLLYDILSVSLNSTKHNKMTPAHASHHHNASFSHF